jgi:hypothetical protein
MERRRGGEEELRRGGVEELVRIFVAKIRANERT